MNESNEQGMESQLRLLRKRKEKKERGNKCRLVEAEGGERRSVVRPLLFVGRVVLTPLLPAVHWAGTPRSSRALFRRAEDAVDPLAAQRFACPWTGGFNTL